MIPKTKIHFKKDVLKVVNKIESEGYDVEVSELLSDGDIYLCAYKQDYGIIKEYLFDLTWDELTGILDKNGIDYFESRS